MCAIIKLVSQGCVAQWTRARGYEPRCRGFESLLAHFYNFKCTSPIFGVCAFLISFKGLGAGIVIGCRDCHWVKGLSLGEGIVIGCRDCHWVKALSLGAGIVIGRRHCHWAQALRPYWIRTLIILQHKYLQSDLKQSAQIAKYCG